MAVLGGWWLFGTGKRARSGVLRANSTTRLIIGSVLVVGGWSTYWTLVGGYSEVPSDFWNHLTRIRHQFDHLESGRLIPYDLTLSQLVNRDYVHALHAILARESHLELLDSVEITAFATSVIFLLATFWFAFALFEQDDWSPWKQAVAALLVVLFVWMSMGIGPFSFVRYYALAPAIVGFVMYYAFLAAWIDLIRGSVGVGAGVARLSLLGAAMLLTHQQEFGFAVVMTVATLGTYLVLGPPAVPRERRKALSLVFFALVVLATVASLVLVIHGEPGPIGSAKVIHLGRHLPMLEDMFILNPAYQFVQVYGVFGLTVTAAALFSLKYLARFPFLVAGLLVPLLTVFNPLFVYIYLHAAKYETLWRMLFVVPLPFIAAVLLVRYIDSFRGKTARSRIVGALVIVVATVSLYPVEYAGFRNANSRMGSLVDTKTQGADWLADVVTFLNQVPRQTVYTDPVTSYVLRGATRHVVPGWKFYGGRSGFNFARLKSNGELGSLLASETGLFVVNKRVVPGTRNGVDSGHWGSNVLDTGRWYPDGFGEMLEEQGATLLFDSNAVRVYGVGARREASGVQPVRTSGALSAPASSE